MLISIRAFLSSTFFVGVVFLPVTHAATTNTFSSHQSPTLETIIVTARKVSEPLLKAPAAISVIDGIEIQQQRLSDISDVQRYVPSLSIATTAPISGSSNAAVIYQRGVGQTEFLLTNDPGVGVYQDGVYLPRSAGSVLNLQDVERVEVLRGSSGVLWGNTIGGAINSISRKPGNTFGGTAGVTLGSDNRRDASLAMDMPITDNISSRLTLSDQNQDGYVKREIDGDELGDKNQQYARLQFLLTPIDTLSMRLIVDKTRAREHSAPTVLLTESAAQFNTETSASSLVGLYNATTGQFLPAPTQCCGANGVYDSRYLTGSRYKNLATGPDESNLDIDSGSLIAEWQINADTQLTSIAGLRHMDTDFQRDPDSSPLIILHTANEVSHHQFNQELRLQGSALADTVDWLAGIWFFKEDGRDRVNYDIIPSLYSSIGLPLSEAGHYDAGSKIWAGFAQATWHFDEAWSATYGLRDTDNKKTYQSTQYLTDINAPLLPDQEYDKSFHDVSQFASVQYQLNTDVLTYLSYSEGFKSGGFVARYIAPEPAPYTFDKETVHTVEWGIKTALPNQQISSNTAVFQSDYDDIQLLTFEGIVPLTQNAGTARIRGIEQEFTWQVNESWKLIALGSWLDTDYLRINSQSLIQANNLFVNTPEWSAHAEIRYSFATKTFGKAEAILAYNWQSETAKDALNTPQMMQGAYDVINAYLIVTPTNARYDVTLYGKNLSDEEYLITGVADIPTFGVAEGAFARSREFGVALDYHF